MLPNARTNVIACQSKRGPSLVLRPECNVHVRVLCVEVRCGHPLKAGSEVFLHARKELPRLVVEIESLAELWRDNYFEDPVVTGSLPSVQGCSNISRLFGRHQSQLATSRSPW